MVKATPHISKIFKNSKNEVIDSEESLYPNELKEIEEIQSLSLEEISKQIKEAEKQFLQSKDDKSCSVKKEKDYYKNEGSELQEDDNYDDKVLHTSFYLSPYAINLVSMIKTSSFSKNTGQMKVLSRAKVILDVLSSTIDFFYDDMMERYNKIVAINRLATEINASSGKVSLIQPKLKIDMGKEEENERVDSLIRSSAQTKVKMMSEEFGVSTSCIAEYNIYLYVCDSKNKIFNESKKYCAERMNLFKTQLDTFIHESTQPNIEDENAIKRLAFKMAALDIIESTKSNNNFKNIFSNSINTDLGSDYNINAKIILRKKNGKRSHDEKNSRGIERQKTGRKPRKI